VSENKILWPNADGHAERTHSEILEWLYRSAEKMGVPYIRPSDATKTMHERIAHLEQALREAEERHDAVVATMHAYLRIWLARHGAPLLVSQDELRAAAAGAPLVFEVCEDGETLRISEEGK
jgi:hypothetical protein